MDKWCKEPKHKCDFIISTGDNFYSSGVSSTKDKKFISRWLEMYDHPSLKDLHWYLTVGNHDHKKCEKCQVSYSKIESRWNMPSLAFSFKMSARVSQEDNVL